MKSSMMPFTMMAALVMLVFATQESLAFVIGSSSISSHNSVTRKTNKLRMKSLQAKKKTTQPVYPVAWTYCYYSKNFHRHVIVQSDTDHKNTTKVLQSFPWLDQARNEYPNVIGLPVNVGMWQRKVSFEELKYALAGCAVDDAEWYKTTRKVWFPSRGVVKPISVKAFKDTLAILDSVGHDSTGFLEHFQQEERGWIQERILFLVSPLPPKLDLKDSQDIDWPHVFSMGNGAGLTPQQTAQLLIDLPHFLWFDPTTTRTRKPPMSFFNNNPSIPLALILKAKKKLDFWLRGTEPRDVTTMAYLYALGLSWSQCRVLLDAFSLSVLSFDLHPSLGLTETGTVRKMLDESALTCLRLRLQLRTRDLYAMIKMHSRLSTYTARHIRIHLDALQSKLGLSSKELRDLVIQKPHVLGIALSKLDDRIAFFESEMGMTLKEIRECTLKFPSLLHYSIDSNLRPKMKFLRDELSIKRETLSQLFVSNPKLFGASLNRKIEPTVDFLCQSLDLSKKQAGDLLVRGNVLRFNHRSNLRPKIMFLKERLGLPTKGISSLILSAPNIFTHSIDGSLRPKLDMLEQHAKCSDSLRETVLSNPSLLLVTKQALEQRIMVYEANNSTLVSPSRGEAAVPRIRSQQSVIEMTADGVFMQTYSNVQDAAEGAGTSVAYMYRIIRKKCVYKGTTRYQYGELQTFQKRSGQTKKVQISSDQLRQEKQQAQREAFLKDVRKNYIPEEVDQLNLLEAIRRYSERAFPEQIIQRTGEDDTAYLAVLCTGRDHKDVDATTLKRPAGAMCIYFPQIRGRLLREAANGIWKMGELLTDIPLSAGSVDSQSTAEVPRIGTDYSNGVIAARYPYLRPSRNRCSLYACREVLRVLAEILLFQRSQNSDSLMKDADGGNFSQVSPLADKTVRVDIFTDSTHVMDLVHNGTRLLEWGSFADGDELMKHLNITKRDQKWANWDILHPLARTYWRLTRQILLVRTTKSGDTGGNSASYAVLQNQRVELAREVVIRFRHTSEWMLLDENTSTVNGGGTSPAYRWWSHETAVTAGTIAQKGAAWQFERQQTDQDFDFF